MWRIMTISSRRVAAAHNVSMAYCSVSMTGMPVFARPAGKACSNSPLQSGRHAGRRQATNSRRTVMIAPVGLQCKAPQRKHHGSRNFPIMSRSSQLRGVGLLFTENRSFRDGLYVLCAVLCCAVTAASSSIVQQQCQRITCGGLSKLSWTVMKTCK